VLSNIFDADVIETFLTRTTCESLVHKLGHKSPRTTKELLDIMTNHASGEEAIGAIFDHAKGKAKRDENAGVGNSNHLGKKKNNGGSLVVAADRKGGKAAIGETLTTLRRCSRSRTRTMSSPSSTCTRTAPS
jgi:hypothetical protein